MGQLLLDGVPIGVPDRSVTAAGVSYDNTQSGLSATDVQGAVDEVAAEKIGFIGATVGSYVNMNGGQSLTATVNCWFTYASNVDVTVLINGIAVASGTNVRQTLPLKKGDVVTVSGVSAGSYALTYRLISMIY